MPELIDALLKIIYDSTVTKNRQEYFHEYNKYRTYQQSIWRQSHF